MCFVDCRLGAALRATQPTIILAIYVYLVKFHPQYESTSIIHPTIRKGVLYGTVLELDSFEIAKSVSIVVIYM